MYRAIQNQSNLFLSLRALVQNSLNILNELLKFNKNFNYFIHVDKVFKWNIEEAGSPLPSHSQIYFNFKL